MPDSPTLTPPSTSTNAATNSPALSKGGLPAVSRLPVRRKAGPVSTAYQVTETETHTVAGRRLVAYPEDWVVTAYDQVVDVLTAKEFREAYDPADESGLHLSGHVLAQLEAKLGPGATATPLALLRAVDRLARIEFGTVKVDFTPGQLEEIAHRARKNGRSPQQEVEKVVGTMREQFFHGGMPMPAAPPSEPSGV